MPTAVLLESGHDAPGHRAAVDREPDLLVRHAPHVVHRHRIEDGQIQLCTLAVPALEECLRLSDQVTVTIRPGLGQLRHERRLPGFGSLLMLSGYQLGAWAAAEPLLRQSLQTGVGILHHRRHSVLSPTAAPATRAVTINVIGSIRPTPT
jgi:hypothetical protein